MPCNFVAGQRVVYRGMDDYYVYYVDRHPAQLFIREGEDIYGLHLIKMTDAEANTKLKPYYEKVETYENITVPQPEVSAYHPVRTDCSPEPPAGAGTRVGAAAGIGGYVRNIWDYERCVEDDIEGPSSLSPYRSVFPANFGSYSMTLVPE